MRDEPGRAVDFAAADRSAGEDESNGKNSSLNLDLVQFTHLWRGVSSVKIYTR